MKKNKARENSKKIVLKIVLISLFICYIVFLLSPNKEQVSCRDQVRVMTTKQFMLEKPPTWEFKDIIIIDCNEFCSYNNS